MNERNALEKLIIKNLNIIETARQMLPNVEKKVFGCIDKMVEEWVDEQDNWTGKFAFIENELSFNPQSWNEKDNKRYSTFQLFCVYENDVTDYLPLLCGEVFPKDKNFMGFYWSMPHNILGGKKQWKFFLNEQFRQYEAELKALNIELDKTDGFLFRRVEIDAVLLADNYPDNIEDSLTPVSKVLEDIKNAYPIIEKIYQAALTA